VPVIDPYQPARLAPDQCHFPDRSAGGRAQCSLHGKQSCAERRIPLWPSVQSSPATVVPVVGARRLRNLVPVCPRNRPQVLFVCVHNAGRSQMAAALLDRATNGRIDVRSAGSEPADELNPAVVATLAEEGIDISREFPKPLSDDAVRAADVVITMGCGDTCPVFPSKRYEDWELEDPAGKDLEAVRRIRDQIAARVEDLAGELLVR